MESNYRAILIPLELDVFWSQVRQIIREEIKAELKKNAAPVEEPLLTREEIAAFLKISLVTLNDWMKGAVCLFTRDDAVRDF